MVGQAPTLLGDPTGGVTHVIVSRRDFAADRPMRILVYAGDGYVEAGPDGAIIATH